VSTSQARPCCPANDERWPGAGSVKVEPGKREELNDRGVLELAHFARPYTDVRMELTVGNETQLYPRFTSARALSGFLM
jgi:hypothetical protein